MANVKPSPRGRECPFDFVFFEVGTSGKISNVPLLPLQILSCLTQPFDLDIFCLHPLPPHGRLLIFCPEVDLLYSAFFWHHCTDNDKKWVNDDEKCENSLFD